MAQETKFVPGPYEAIGQNVYAYGEDGTNIMSVMVQDPRTSNEALEATAQMLSAGPEMFEALQQYEAFLERTIAMVTGGSDISDANFATSMNALLDMSASALSKARGEL